MLYFLRRIEHYRYLYVSNALYTLCHIFYCAVTPPTPVSRKYPHVQILASQFQRTNTAGTEDNHKKTDEELLRLALEGEGCSHNDEEDLDVKSIGVSKFKGTSYRNVEKHFVSKEDVGFDVKVTQTCRGDCRREIQGKATNGESEHETG